MVGTAHNHESYAYIGYADIAVIILDEPITTIQPVKLAVKSTVKWGQEYTGAGWGSLQAGNGPYPTKLQ